MAQWMARLAVNKEGVLYEDKLVQIGLKTALTGTKLPRSRPEAVSKPPARPARPRPPARPPAAARALTSPPPPPPPSPPLVLSGHAASLTPY